MRTREFSPQEGDVKPDDAYIRELIREELNWPIESDDRYFGNSGHLHRL